MTTGARLYRALLRLYPAGFRAEYGAEMCAAFAERAARIDGPFAPLRIVLAAVGDVVPNAIGAHREVLAQDLRHAARSLRRTPGFTVTAILLVALGVGANTAAFSLADFVFVRPLPFPDADRLVKVWQASPGYSRVEMSPALHRDWASMARSFSAFGAYVNAEVNLVGLAEPRRLTIARVTPDVLPLLGVPALAGRVIAPADSADGAVVVVSHALWRGQFGGADDIVGRVVRLDGVPHTVIGVMPPSFHFPDRRAEAWTPLLSREEDFADRSNNYFAGIARLRPGATVDRAREELEAAAAVLAEQYPEDGEAPGATVYLLRDELSPRARLLVLALCGAAVCILLLAGANLASLLLARGEGRRRELAVRTALGAGRERLVRQLVTESVALALVGGVVGIAVAAASVPLLAHLVPSGLPVAERPTLDARVLALAVLVVGATSLLFGVLPGVRVGDASVADALRDGVRTAGGRTRRLRAALVVVEVASSVVLLVSSGLLIRAVWRIQSVDPGFRAAEVLTARTVLPRPRYDVTERRARFYDRVLNDVRALPGVTGAAYISGLPMRMRGGIWPVEIPGREAPRDESHLVSLRFVTPDLFRTLGVPLVQGRDVAESDTREAPFVAVVSESFARRHWPNEDPIGQRFGLAFSERTVVGVVGDVRVRGLEQSSEPQVYLPYRQVPDSSLVGYFPKDLVVRTSGAAAPLLPAIRRAVRAADPEQPVSDVEMLSEIVAGETAPRVTQLRLLALLSAIALVIAAVGIHGLLTVAVARRSQELAVRRALGARVMDLVGLVLAEGMLLAVVGIVAGVSLAYPAARAMGALLAGIEPADPLTLGVVSALCLAAAGIGCLRPAVRAARADPLAAMRAE